jgi:hypothetical protein
VVPTVVTDQINDAMGGERSTHEDEKKNALPFLSEKLGGMENLRVKCRIIKEQTNTQGILKIN